MAGEEIRQVLGIDGTAGDAQDVDHPYVPTNGGACLVCGLAVSYRRHTMTWAEATPPCSVIAAIAFVVVALVIAWIV